MRTASIVFAAVFVSLVLCAYGCVPGLQMTKPAADGPAPEGKSEAPAGAPTDTARQPDKKADAQVPPPPDYKPPALSEGLLEGPADLSWKDEVSASALEFAKNIPNVKHAKICFSKLYGGEGGWYLLLYVEKAKKIGLQQYSWSPKYKEWEPSFQLKEIPAKQVELHLKGEVQDEKCFILKHAN